jgi:hypothetical protein
MATLDDALEADRASRALAHELVNRHALSA